MYVLNTFQVMALERIAVVALTLALLGVAAAGGAGAAATDAGSTPDVTITVAVSDAFNNPIRDVAVTATWDGGETTDQTRSNGEVLLDVPEGATVTLTFSHRAYTKNNPVVIESASSERVPVTVYREAQATISVANSEGEPVSDATVVLRKDGTEAVRGTTDGSGSFESGVIEKGDYTVSVVKSGFYRNETTLTVTDSVSSTVRVSEGSVTVTVAVVDNHYDPAKALEGASVEIEDIGTVTTGAKGEQTIAVPVNSQVSLSISKEGYTTSTRTISVGEQSTDVSVTITRTDSLSVAAGNTQVVAGQNVRLEVTDEYGDPVEGATISVDGEAVGQTDAEGVYSATLSDTGAHDITASKEGVTSSVVTVEAVEPASDATPTETAPPSVDESSASPSPSATSSNTVPGFGFLVAVLALAAVALVAGRRR